MERIDRLEERVETLEETIHGSKDGPGIKGRLASVEELAQGVRKLYWSIAFCGVGIFITFVWDIVRGRS